MFALTQNVLSKKVARLGNCRTLISVSEEVRFALESNKPIVALESTIITHGMPFPDNIKCALEVEATVRQHGAVPATIAIIKGQIKAGLNSNELNQLGDIKITKPIKTSRRDLSYVVANKLNGGTTVSGTLIVAHRLNLPIFATGGIGGVHREGETTFDISADLIELGRSSVAVICSGIKSILDIPKTLEFLETQGVFVASFGDSKEFPAFYCRRSGFSAPYAVESPLKAAEVIHNSLGSLNLGSGMVFGVGVPEEFSLDERIIDGAIGRALDEARGRGIRGKEITPFLLGRIADITEGQSLKTNMALIKNNAKTAAEIAVELAGLKLGGCGGNTLGNNKKDEIRPVVIGGSNLDCSIHLEAKGDIQMDGRMHYGKFTFSAGGVGRNMADALTKLGCPPLFISALGKDPQGAIMKEMMPKELLSRINFMDFNTGQCAVVLDSNGDCKFLIGDMDIHKRITPEMVVENVDAIKRAPLIVFDANLADKTIDQILALALENNIPVFFEPTDLVISSKPFESEHWNAIKFISPNLNELRHIASHFDIISQSKTDKFDEVVEITSKLIKHIDNIIVTLGADGLVIARNGSASDPLLQLKTTEKLSVRHYPVDRVKNFVNVNGAGDSLASGIIAAMLQGKSEEECVAVGIAAAKTALCSSSTVAQQLFAMDHPAWVSKAHYNKLL